MDPFWDRAISNNNNDPDDDEEKRPTRRHHAEKKSTRPDHKMAVDSDDEDKMAIDSDLEERAVVDLADFTDPDGRGTPYTPLDVDQCIEMLRDEIEESGGTVYQDSLNCFAQASGKYLNLVNTKTTWVNDFTRFWLPTYDAYNWLSPYNGNAHNRSFFTQLVLYVVTKAKHRHNRNWMPDIYELFVGTGQIFMGATAFADLLLEEPPFDGVGGGDLNRHLIAAYEALKVPGLVDEYLATAEEVDTLLQQEIDEYLAAAAEHQGAPPERESVVFQEQLQALNRLEPTEGNRARIGVRYIWLVNRCLRGATLAPDGSLVCKINWKVNLESVRKREQEVLPSVVKMVTWPVRFFYHADFADTAKMAAPKDVVVMDCPFPVFTWDPPDTPGELICKPSHTYGTEDGAPLQQRILAEVKRLVKQGTTVLLCNFANPDLIQAYANVLEKFGIKNTKDYIYTYKSPGNDSSVYQLVIFPGYKVDMTHVPATIRTIWDGVTGNSNFKPATLALSSPEPSDDDMDYSGDSDYSPSGNSESEDSEAEHGSGRKKTRTAK